jgi:hypothetical protein
MTSIAAPGAWVSDFPGTLLLNARALMARGMGLGVVATKVLIDTLVLSIRDCEFGVIASALLIAHLFGSDTGSGLFSRQEVQHDCGRKQGGYGHRSQQCRSTDRREVEARRSGGQQARAARGDVAMSSGLVAVGPCLATACAFLSAL